MKALCIHAHFDDFEFVAAGTFELWKRKLGAGFRGKLVVCTDGQAGHHRLSRAQTGKVRLKEQQESARLGGYDFELLRLPGGRVPREGCIESGRDMLAALWKVIREFEPDYLFVPPLPVDPAAGVHVDHWMVAEAVRKVAYLINVPHAFTPEFPSGELEPKARKVPVILTTYDAYMAGSNCYDLVVDTEPVFQQVLRLTWCHQSQISEWLPWVGRHSMTPPRSLEEWERILRQRLARQNRDLGLRTTQAREVFGLTAWGEVADPARILQDLPGLRMTGMRRERAISKLRAWKP